MTNRFLKAAALWCQVSPVTLGEGPLLARLILVHLTLAVSLAAGEIRRTPLVLTQGGTPEQPAVFDGRGLIIDLGIDITDQDWAKQGDVWIARAPRPDHPPVADTQRAGLFIDEVPLRIARDHAAERAAGVAGTVIYTAPERLQPGQMGWTAEGALYFRWPKGKTPGGGRIIRPPGKLESGVVIACSHIIVRNLTVRHAANDGFNIHGHRVGIRLENVKAFSNGDEGISAHETVQMDVFDSEIAWNGSAAGGVADVNDSVTSYTRCEVHHNLGAAFFFDGKHHRVTDCLIHHQDRDIVVRGDAVVEQCRFENAGERPLNIGGSTGLKFFRPPDAKHEAKDITVRGNHIAGGLCAAAFAGVDGALFEDNTVLFPGRWIFRILQENRAEGFVPCRNGVVRGNRIVFRRADIREEVNTSPGVAAQTFRFENNRWFAEDRPDASRPRLPVEETGGVYGTDPRR